MDTAGLASAASPLVVAAITGAETRYGTGTVQVVADLVRERLEVSEQGQAALRGLDPAPDDSVAAERLRSALRDALDADPAFAQRLNALLEAPSPPPAPPVPAGSVVIGNSNRLRGSNISLGPLTISTTRGGPGMLWSLIAVALGIVALAVYGGVQVIGVDDTPGGRTSDAASRQDTTEAEGDADAPSSSAGGAGGEGNPLTDARRRPVLKDQAVVMSVLPGLDAVPGGWTQESAPKVLKASGSQCPSAPPDVLFCGAAEYEDPSTNNGVYFEVYPFSSAGAAKSAYQAAKQDHPPSIALPALGDESHAYDRQGSSSKGVRSMVRFGSVVVGVTYLIEAVDWTEAYGADHLEILTRMLTERTQQACNGQQPTARATL